jgi:hypothetical protein
LAAVPRSGPRSSFPGARHDAGRAVAADAAADPEPEGKSYLTFLVEALGLKYVIIFLLL